MKNISFALLTISFLLLLPSVGYSQIKIEAAKAKKNYNTDFIVSPMDDGVSFSKNTLTLAPKNEGVTYTLTGYFKGQVVNKTKNTIIKLDNAYIENSMGDPAIYGFLKTEISTVNGTENYVVSYGKNKNEKKTASIQSKKGLELGGSGTLYVYGLVNHGVKADGVKMKGSGKFYFQGAKDGAALNCERFSVEQDKTFYAYFINSKNGLKADTTIDVLSGNFYFYDNETAIKTDLKKDSPEEEHHIFLDGGIFHFERNKKNCETEDGFYKADGAKFPND
mgnify:CR=1 FL=1